MSNDFKNVHYKLKNNEEACNTFNDVEQILEKEKTYNAGKSWNKLEKSIKIVKLYSYADEYSKEKNLTPVQSSLLKSFLKNCLDKKRLECSKDITYSNVEDKIENIPRLNFNNKRFTLKKIDKKGVSSLAPKTKTIKKKDINKT